MSQYLSEAFKRLNFLNEETFSITDGGLEDFEKFRDEDEIEDSIDVIDPEADTEEDLEDSYVGKVILDCCVCHSKLYKDVEDVIIDGDIANTNEECPFCYTVDGFKVIGQVASFNGEKDDDDVDDLEQSDDKSELTEGIFGIKTKKEKEKEAKAKAEREAKKKADAEAAERRERERQADVVRDWKEWEDRKRQAKADYNRSRYNSISGDNPSNTGYRGVNYSGGDYYSEGILGKKDKQLYDVWCSYDGDTWVASEELSEKEADKEIAQAYKDNDNAPGYKAWKEPHKETKANEGLFGKKKKPQQKQSQGSSSAPQQWELFDIIRGMTTGQKFDNKYDADKEAASREKATGHVYKVQLVESVNNVNVETDESKSIKERSFNEGIFDKKNSADYKNKKMQFDNAVEQATKGKSLHDIAYGLVDLINSAISSFRVLEKKNDNHQSLSSGKNRVYESKAKIILTMHSDAIKQLKKPTNFNAPGYVIRRMVNKILADYASDCDIPSRVDTYCEMLHAISSIEADSKVKKNELNEFFKKVSYYLENNLTMLKKKNASTLFESINNIAVDTDDTHMEVSSDENGKVTVSTEPAGTTDTGDEVIEPLDADVQNEIEDNVGDGEEIEIDMEEFDEESFDQLGESYLKRVYENVNSFKTSKVSFIKDRLILEGVINFTSGKSKKTNFIFGMREATKSGKVRFIGENKEIARGRKSFTVTGRVEGNRFLSESLNYNYGVRDAQGRAQRLYGTVKNNKRG